jgi:hypothetical protein
MFSKVLRRKALVTSNTGQGDENRVKDATASNENTNKIRTLLKEVKMALSKDANIMNLVNNNTTSIAGITKDFY